MMQRMAGRFYLGTSGFAYDEWRKGVFYPEDLKKDDMLDYYSTQLSSVEVNYTFRRFPTEKTVEKWRAKAAPGFVFTLKANQRITHWKKLEDVGEDVRDFVARGKLLGDRFGCVLFQCPPSLKYDAALLDAFLATLPAGGPSYAMEFRHDSWAAARDRLLDAGVGWCVAETDENDPKPEDLSWEPVGYLRLRKTEYSDEELREWAGRIQPALDGGATIFCYFKHEDEGASPKMAKRLEAMLQVPPRATMPVARRRDRVDGAGGIGGTGGRRKDAVLHGNQHRRVHRRPGQLPRLALPGARRRARRGPVGDVHRRRRCDGDGRHHLRVDAGAREAARRSGQVARVLRRHPVLGLHPPRAPGDPERRHPVRPTARCAPSTRR